jgi:hypothetical protein
MNPLIGRTCHHHTNAARPGVICHIDRLDGKYERAGEVERRMSSSVVVIVLLPLGVVELWDVTEITVQ